MTVANISSNTLGQWPSPNKSDLDASKQTDPADKLADALEKEDSFNQSGEEKISPDSVVLKPSPVSLEERMNQVISFEEMKNLLSMMAKSSKTNSEKKIFHFVDVKR